MPGLYENFLWLLVGKIGLIKIVYTCPEFKRQHALELTPC